MYLILMPLKAVWHVMYEASREQHPLLCDDFSEEEQFTEYPRKLRPLHLRGRARNSIKGAAAILKRWPDHWSSVFTYWWIGVTMTAVLVFVIYNTLVAFVLLTPVHMKPVNSRTSNTVDIFKIPSHLPEIYMHVFANTAEEVDVNKYLPNIEMLSDKHLDFNFNLVVVYNDSVNYDNTLSAEENNDMAYNSLWDKKYSYSRKLHNRKNINIKYVVLSHYLDESPLKKNWRRIPNKFIEFLVKAVSVWDKGGIAINPTVFTSNVSSVYNEKIQNILKNYKMPMKNKFNDNKNNFNKNKLKSEKRVNNIRDIINILEHEDLQNSHSIEDNLIEAESKFDNQIAPNARKLMSVSSSKQKNKTDFFTYVNANENDTELTPFEIDLKSVHKNNDMTDNFFDKEGSKNISEKNHNKFSLLPLFLEYLFHDKPITYTTRNEEHFEDNLIRHRKNALPISEKSTKIPANLNKTQKNTNDSFKPMIISAKGVIPDVELKVDDNDTDIRTDYELTVDLRGNVLATRIPCHAFIGTLLTDAVHLSTEETLRDFIIEELSLFCKGILSSCKGIDVILI